MTKLGPEGPGPMLGPGQGLGQAQGMGQGLGLGQGLGQGLVLGLGPHGNPVLGPPLHHQQVGMNQNLFYLTYTIMKTCI